MENQSVTLKFAGFAALFLIILVLLTWVNYRYSIENPGGSDFLFGYVATRLFLKEGLNPYSEDVQIAIQEGFYGRQPVDGEDELIFVYPFYSVYMFSPFSLFSDYNLSRALWMTTLEISIILTVIFSIRLVDWRPSSLLLALLLIFSILWYHGLRSIINGNIVVVTTLFVVISLLLMKSEHDFASGIMLALATIKPNVIILLLLFIIIWSLYSRRWLIIMGIVSGILILIFTSMLFIPDWIIQNVTHVIAYSKYPTIASPGEYLIYLVPGVGRQLSWLIAIVLGLLLIVEWRASLGKEYRWFLWTACLTLVIGQWIGITTDPGNYILLLLPLILVLTTLDCRWRKIGRIWVVIMLLTVFFGLWILFLNTLEYRTQPIQHPILYFPVPLLLIIGLYWIRWYAIKPIRLGLINPSDRTG